MSDGRSISDESFGPVVLQPQTPRMDYSTGTTGASLSEEVLPSAGQPAAPGSEQNPYKAVVEFTQKLEQARQVGRLQFRESALGHELKSGRISLDAVKKQLEDDDKLAQLSGDLEQYEKDSWGSWITGIPTSIALGAAKQLPMLEASLTLGVPAGVAAGGAVAATGVGAPLAVPFGEMVGTAVAAGWSADYITGQEYLQRRLKGVPHEEALATSSLSGIVQGTLSGIRFGQIAKMPVDAAKGAFKAHAANVANTLWEGLKFSGIQVGLAEVQTATKLMMDAVAGTVSKTPGVVPTAEQAASEFASTFAEALKGGIGFFLGGKVAGTSLGLTGKALVKGFEKVKDAHLANQRAKLAPPDTAGQPQSGGATTAPAAKATKPAKKGQSKRQKRLEARRAKREAAEQEVNRIFSAAESIFSIERDETRSQESGRIQRLLKRMIKNSDLLDDAAKTRLLGRITEIDSVKDLLKLGSKFIDDLREGEYKNQLNAATERLKAAIKSGQAKGKKAKLSPEAQKSLVWYKEFFGAPKREKGQGIEDVREQALKKAVTALEEGIAQEAAELQKQVDKLEQGKLAELFDQAADLVEKRRIAQEAAQFWSESLDPKGIEALAGKIEKIVETGKSEFLEAKKAEGERLKANRGIVKEAVQGKNPVVPSKAKTAPKQLPAWKVLFDDLTKTSTALWDKLLQDTAASKRIKIVRDILDFTQAENRESDINIDASEKLTELYKEAAGSMREANKLIRKGSKSELFEETYTDATQKTQMLGRASINELVYLHLAFEDPGAIPGLVFGNHYTLDGMVEAGQTSTQTAVRRILEEREGGKYLDMADAIRDFYQWFAPVVANHYFKEYGVELPTNDNYSGRIIHRKIELSKAPADLLEGVHNYMQQMFDPASTKLRRNSKLPVRLVDPFKQVTNHYQEMAFWVANSEKARELSFIFSDTSQDGLRDIIAHKFGSEMNGLIDARLGFQFHLKPGLAKVASGAYQTVANNMATGLLGARLDQAPKQWTSVLAALSTNTPAQFLDGLIRASDQKQMKAYLERSSLYRDRQDQLLPQIMDATRDQAYLDAVAGDRLRSLKSFFLIPMSKWGDGVASALTGFIEYNRLVKAGVEPDKAAIAADALVDRTQSSSRASQNVPAEFEGKLGKFSMKFAKQNIQNIVIESGVIRDALIHKDAEHAARAFRTIAGIHTAQALFQAINSLPAWVSGDEDEIKDASLRVAGALALGGFSQLPLIGWDVGTAAVSAMLGEKSSEPKTIIGGLAKDSALLFSRWAKIASKVTSGEEGVDDEEWAKAFKSVAGVVSVVTGIPFWGLFKTGEFAQKVAEKVSGEGE